MSVFEEQPKKISCGRQGATGKPCPDHQPPPDVHWSAEWKCGDCGARGEAQFEDGCWVESEHDCEADE